MPPLLDHPPLVEHHHPVRLLRGAEAMGHHEGRAAGQRSAQRAQDLPFFRRVHRCEHVVEHEERRASDESARQRHALSLTSGQRQSSLSYHVSHPRGKPWISSSSPADSAADVTCGSEASSSASRTLSPSEREKRNASCGT